ncbi:phage holin family protein [soil metagenome]
MADEIRVTPVTGGAAAGEPSLGELFKQLAEDSAMLVRQEVALAKVEMSHNIKSAARSAAMVAVGGMIAFVGVLVLVAGIVILLGAALNNYWLAALIVGIVFLAIGGLLAMSNLNKLKAEELAPERTIQTLQEDKQWIQKEIKQVKTDLTT